MASLTLSEMKALVRDNQSVIYNGTVIASIKDLPTEAELAAGNPEAEKIAKQNIELQIKELMEQKALLDKQIKDSAESKKASEAKSEENKAK